MVPHHVTLASTNLEIYGLKAVLSCQINLKGDSGVVREIRSLLQKNSVNHSYEIVVEPDIMEMKE